jgi:Asp/Glu/hydantoin racemase
MRIACLHTADSNIAVFEEAAEEIGLPKGTLQHEVRRDLLEAAEHAGGLTPDVEKSTASALADLSRKADAVILTCATLGPIVATVKQPGAVPIMRGDDALATQAVEAGGRVVVLCATETAVPPTAKLFVEAARRTSAEIDVQLVPGAGALLRAGDRAAYLSMIAEAAEAAYKSGAKTVALGQASMAAAVRLVKTGPLPLSSPATGLTAAIERIAASASKA